jgi:hypothetical protein
MAYVGETVQIVRLLLENGWQIPFFGVQQCAFEKKKKKKKKIRVCESQMHTRNVHYFERSLCRKLAPKLVRNGLPL